MPLFGACLKIRFSVCNQLGVVSNDIPCGILSNPPVLADFAAEVGPLFGGQLLNLSEQQYTLTEVEKRAVLDNSVPRYGRTSVSGTYWKATDPTEQIGFYFTGLGLWVAVDQIRQLILDHAKMRDGTAPDSVFVGAFKLVE